eukprot:8888162-Lingulodinium_polyedra.AAC.1
MDVWEKEWSTRWGGWKLETLELRGDKVYERWARAEEPAQAPEKPDKATMGAEQEPAATTTRSRQVFPKVPRNTSHKRGSTGGDSDLG